MRIKMPREFSDKQYEKSAWDEGVAAQRRERERTDGVVYELSWNDEGTISVHATEEGAYKTAALHIVKTWDLMGLRRVLEEFVDQEGCDCLCHNECDCDCGGEHEPYNDFCYFEDCGTSDQCCVTSFNGESVAADIIQMFREERYEMVFSEWNSFWLQLKEAQLRHNEEVDDDSYVLEIRKRVVLP